MRIVIDMNLGHDWVSYLGTAGHDVVHWSSVGPDDEEDVMILDWAAEHDRAVFTCDLDFGEAVIRSGRSAPSVIQLRTQQTLPVYVGPAVLAALTEAEAGRSPREILTITSGRTRRRPLASKD